MLKRGSADQWDMVRRMRLAPRPGTEMGMAQILDLASPNLEALVLEGPGWQPTESPECYWESSHRVLEAMITDSGITFQSLTSLKLGYSFLTRPDCIWHICVRAPNLVDLHVDSVHRIPCGSDWKADHTVNRDLTTKLRRLRIELGDDDYHFDYSVNCAFVRIIDSSPNLRQLFISYPGYFSEDPIPLFNTDCFVRGIQDLQIIMDNESVENNTDIWENDSLQRLVLSSPYWSTLDMVRSSDCNLLRIVLME